MEMPLFSGKQGVFDLRILTGGCRGRWFESSQPDAKRESLPSLLHFRRRNLRRRIHLFRLISVPLKGSRASLRCSTSWDSSQSVHGSQLRGVCPLHGSRRGTSRCFSVNVTEHKKERVPVFQVRQSRQRSELVDSRNESKHLRCGNRHCEAFGHFSVTTICSL